MIQRWTKVSSYEKNSRILHTIANAIDNKEDIKKRIENRNKILQELLTCVQNCQNRFGGKSELATEDDIRIVQLCEKWETALSHGIRMNLSNSAIQSLVNAGLNFTFNIDNVGNSLWSYTCLHLTKHEKERFKILNNINSPLGYFRAFLRASLNERSLERYLQSWINHGLIMEYYEEGSLVREAEVSHLLPNMAAGMSAILFALAIDRVELNDTQQPTNSIKSEHVIPLPVPVKSSTGLKRKPLRQIISFERNEEDNNSNKDRRKSYQPTTGTEDSCKSAPPTCLNSPDPNSTFQNATCSISEPTSTDFKSVKQFFPDSVKGIDSPSQILSRLSECAKEIFSSSHSIDVHNVKDDVSDVSITNLKISESDSEEVAGSIDGSTSCLELCFTEDESGQDDNSIQSVLAKKDQDYMALQLKCSQIEITSKDKIKKLEKLVLDLSKENDRLKEQLKTYMSAVGIGRALKNQESGEGDSQEINEYEKKLVQVAEMHAELMEFNQHLQRRLLELENSPNIEMECSDSNVKIHIPAAFLVGKKSHSYHVYQIFIKIGQEEWNVYHRYAKFHELHMQLKKCHNDIASFKFPPKKTLGKKDARVVERRRVELQTYLRHVVLVLPELRSCISRANLVTLLPFFGFSSSNRENGMSQTVAQRQMNVQDSVPSYAAL